MITVDPHRAICALTSVLDFVGVDEVQHGKRVAVMAEAMAQTMGWDQVELAEIFYAGMLHDCGVSQTREHRCLTEGLVWDGAEAHCVRGAEYLAACGPLTQFAPVVRWHHTPWAELQGMALDPAVKRKAHLIFLADRVDVLQAPYLQAHTPEQDILLHKDGIIATVRQHVGSLFDPELVEVFADSADREAFWLAMDPYYLLEYIESYPLASPLHKFSHRSVLELARLFARVVDAKSHYTHEHSTRVAALARYIRTHDGVGEDALDLIEVAGLLHDIGKLRVPDEIIEKPGALTPAEYALVTRHSYDTYRILSRVFPDDHLAQWAASHHENLLGTGYPFRQPASKISRETRIISVADVYQALSQDRPYRARLSKEAVADRLSRMRDEGQLDADIVAFALAHQDALYQLASE